MHRLEVTLPGVASSVPPARRFVERTLEQWDLEALGWAAALVVTELAANAALHAGTEFTVTLQHEGDSVRVEVRDGSDRLPRTRSHSIESTTGRGLRLVAELARAWGVREQDPGKAVWAELATTPSSGAGEDDDVDVDALLDAFGDDLDVAEPDGPHSARALLRRAA